MRRGTIRQFTQLARTKKSVSKEFSILNLEARMKESMSSSYHPLLARPENYGTDTTLLTHLGFVSKSSFEIFDQSANNVEGLPFDLNSLCKLAEIMGACHDAAKCTSYFQEYIRSDGKRNLGSLKRTAHFLPYTHLRWQPKSCQMTLRLQFWLHMERLPFWHTMADSILP